MQERLKEGPGFRSFIDLLCVCVQFEGAKSWRCTERLSRHQHRGPICWAPVDGSVVWWGPFVISSAAGSVRGVWMGSSDMTSLSRVPTGTRSKPAITGWSMPGRATLSCHCHCLKSSVPPSTREEEGGKDKSWVEYENKVAEVSSLGNLSNKCTFDYLKKVLLP